jgi:hypothetical protein
MTLRITSLCRFFGALALMGTAFTATAQNGLLRFSSATYSVAESGGAARITVTRTGGSAGTVTVDFTTIDSGGGTAAAEVDYTPTSGTLTFGPGVTSQSFNIPVLEDAVHEDNETVLIELNNFTGGAGPGSIVSTLLSITDNDACVYSFSPTSLTLDSNGGLAPAIGVTATDGCAWNATIATAGATWLAIVSGQAGVGNGAVILSCDPNPGSGSRTAKLNIAGKSYNVTQLPIDLTSPTVTITSPAAGSRQTNDTIAVTGKASDNVAVTLVEIRLENDAGVTDYAPATGTENWSAMVAGLVPGTNTIRVRARDAANTSVEVTRAVLFVEVRPLTVITNGAGAITPFRNGQFLEVGKAYTAQAKPASRYFFTGWSGTIESGDNLLTFAMQPDFILQANFIASPFANVAGSYHGLCYEWETYRHESSGLLMVRLADLGAFSASLILGGKRISFAGRFALDGLATNTIVRTGANTLTVLLGVDLAGGSDQITGTISDGNWTASVLANRALFDKTDHPAPQEGRYTFILPGDDGNAANQPGGDSFGTVTVDASGSVKVSGTLADGTTFSQKAPLSKNGWWPLYVPLYGGEGAIFGWVIFLESPEADFTGSLNWIKPALASAKYYPDGFALPRDVSGARYRPPTNSTDRILTFSDGRVRFSAGNLAEEFEEPVSLGDNNKVTDGGPNKLTLSIAPSSGLITGRVTPPGTAGGVVFRGAVYQKLNYGAGFFLGIDQSGRFLFSE